MKSYKWLLDQYHPIFTWGDLLRTLEMERVTDGTVIPAGIVREYAGGIKLVLTRRGKIFYIGPESKLAHRAARGKLLLDGVLTEATNEEIKAEVKNAGKVVRAEKDHLPQIKSSISDLQNKIGHMQRNHPQAPKVRSSSVEEILAYQATMDDREHQIDGYKQQITDLKQQHNAISTACGSRRRY